MISFICWNISTLEGFSFRHLLFVNHISLFVAVKCVRDSENVDLGIIVILVLERCGFRSVEVGELEALIGRDTFLL